MLQLSVGEPRLRGVILELGQVLGIEEKEARKMVMKNTTLVCNMVWLECDGKIWAVLDF